MEVVLILIDALKMIIDRNELAKGLAVLSLAKVAVPQSQLVPHDLHLVERVNVITITQKESHGVLGLCNLVSSEGIASAFDVQITVLCVHRARRLHPVVGSLVIPSMLIDSGLVVVEVNTSDGMLHRFVHQRHRADTIITREVMM